MCMHLVLRRTYSDIMSGRAIKPRCAGYSCSLRFKFVLFVFLEVGCIMMHYFIVATHILDGDLWYRTPCRLVQYQPELKFSEYDIQQWPKDTVKRALIALEWAKDIYRGHQAVGHTHSEV